MEIDFASSGDRDVAAESEEYEQIEDEGDPS